MSAWVPPVLQVPLTVQRHACWDFKLPIGANECVWLFVSVCLPCDELAIKKKKFFSTNKEIQIGYFNQSQIQRAGSRKASSAAARQPASIKGISSRDQPVLVLQQRKIFKKKY